MKQTKTSKKSHGPQSPLDAQKFPAAAQTAATPGRDKVREMNPVHAPRESKRPMERTKKG